MPKKKDYIDVEYAEIKESKSLPPAKKSKGEVEKYDPTKDVLEAGAAIAYGIGHLLSAIAKSF